MVRFLKTKFNPFTIGWINVISTRDENANITVYLKTEEISLFEYIIAERFITPALLDWLKMTPQKEIAEYLFNEKKLLNSEMASEWIFWKFTFKGVLSLEKTEMRDSILERCYGASVRKFQSLNRVKLPKEHKRLGRFFFFTTMDKKENVIVVPYGRKWFEENEVTRGNFEDVATRMCLLEGNKTFEQYLDENDEKNLCEWIEFEINK